ncbi:multidrug ABC transporter permease [Leuconostoc mesenteroides]
MITWIEIKDTFRNKRFILFTIVFPLAWYLMILSILNGTTHNPANNYLWFTIAAIIGISGNSVVTFSKKICDTYQFYKLQSQTSHYSIKRWITDQFIVQVILNSCILFVILVAGVLFESLPINLSLFMLFILLLIMGLYLNAIGFLIGVYVDQKTITALSMPLSTGFGVLMIRWDTVTSSKGVLIKIVSITQQFFPGYYIFDYIKKIEQSQSVSQSLLKFLLSILLIAIPFIVIYWKKKHIASQYTSIQVFKHD